MKDNHSTSKSKGIFKWGDLILVAILLVAVVLTCVFATSKEQSEAQIFVDGKLVYASVDLSKNQQISLLDGKMLVVVEDGYIFVKESDCKQQLCTHAAKINRSGGMIVCLPNRVVIKIASKEVDAIS